MFLTRTMEILQGYLRKINNQKTTKAFFYTFNINRMDNYRKIEIKGKGSYG